MAALALTGWLLMPRRRLLHFFFREPATAIRFTSLCGVSKPGDLRGLKYAEKEAQPDKCKRCDTKYTDLLSRWV
jgi:hypothetical protein